jgi:hypothetical protein
VGFAIHHLNGIADSQGKGIRYINIFVWESEWRKEREK